MTRITIECCGGIESYHGQCLRKHCPNYSKAQHEVSNSWHYVGTGYGNLYGEPTHSNILSKVRDNLEENESSD